MVRGTVISLHRFPVKSMAGETVGTLEVGEHGAAGDREHALWLRGGRKLTAKSAPRMLAWHASVDGDVVVTTRTSPGPHCSMLAWIMRLSPGGQSTVTAAPQILMPG